MIGAMIVDISDGIDDGDVDCVVFEPVLLSDLLPPLPMVVVHQTSPNKIPSHYSINSDLTKEKRNLLPIILDVLDQLFELARLKVMLVIACQQFNTSTCEKCTWHDL